jgi:Fanconi anemia group J protein
MLSVCQTIPHGVLCFLPSYNLLEKLVARWQDTGMWQNLSNIKTLVCESRDSNAFEETLKDFYSAIEDSQRYSFTVSFDFFTLIDQQCPKSLGHLICL